MNNPLVSAAAFVLALIIFFGYVNPTWTGSIAATQATIAANQQALSAASDYTARENELASARNAIDPANLARLSTFLPDSVSNVRIILDLDALAARSGLSLSSINVANASVPDANNPQPSSASPVGSVDLSLSASGSYTAFKTFLMGIEDSARLLDVSALTVNGSDTGVYTYQMTVRLYWLR